VESRIEGIDHVGADIAEMDRTIRFYTELLGFSIIGLYHWG
jgi:catechol 2,3-dioxygenase-like lactoylglutathione lyase family enzyme